jgi:cytochrome c oxidase subunit II
MKKLLLLAIISMFTLGLAACGGSDSSKEADVTIEATNWDFNQEEYHVKAGDVTIALKNVSGHHGITIDNTDINIQGEGTDSANLKPGEYIIRCSIACGTGHTQMTAKLIVE